MNVFILLIIFQKKSIKMKRIMNELLFFFYPSEYELMGNK